MEIRAIFERFKAYPGGNDALWATNEIANANKHFALKPLILARPDAFFSARITSPESFGDIVSPGGDGIGWDSGKNEITLLAVQAGSKADINIHIAISIAIEGISIQGSETALTFLDAARNEVERVLMATEAECRRSGFIP